MVSAAPKLSVSGSTQQKCATGKLQPKHSKVLYDLQSLHSTQTLPKYIRHMYISCTYLCAFEIDRGRGRSAAVGQVSTLDHTPKQGHSAHHIRKLLQNGITSIPHVCCITTCRLHRKLMTDCDQRESTVFDEAKVLNMIRIYKS